MVATVTDVSTAGAALAIWVIASRMSKIGEGSHITPAKQKLGWEPKVSLEEGLACTIAYFDTLLRKEENTRRMVQDTSADDRSKSEGFSGRQFG